MTNNRLFYITNSENLKNILTVGLISDRSGYYKYYEDSLKLFPGFIPLFKDKVPKSVLNINSENKSSISPVLIEIDYTGLNAFGRVKLNSNASSEFFSSTENGINNTPFNPIHEPISVEEKYNEYDYFLLNPPLSLSSIKSIIFPDNKTKNDFIIQLSGLSSIYGSDLRIKTDKKLFSTKEDFLINPLDNSNDSLDYTKIYSFGGGIAALFYFSCISRIANDAFHNISKQDLSFTFSDSANNDFFNLFFNNESGNIKSKLINTLIHSKDYKSDIIELLMEYEKSESSERGKRAKEIAVTLLNFIQKKEFSTSEYLNRSKSSLERWLIVLFNKSSIEEFLQTPPAYYKQLSDEDIITIAFLLGIKDKYIKIPTGIKSFKGIQNFISDAMVLFARGNSINLQKYDTIFDIIINKTGNNRFKEEYNRLIKGNFIKYKYILPNPTQIYIDKSTYFITEDEIKYNEIIFNMEDIANSLKSLLFDMDKYSKIFNTLISK